MIRYLTFPLLLMFVLGLGAGCYREKCPEPLRKRPVCWTSSASGFLVFTVPCDTPGARPMSEMHEPLRSQMEAEVASNCDFVNAAIARRSWEKGLDP